MAAMALLPPCHRSVKRLQKTWNLCPALSPFVAGERHCYLFPRITDQLLPWYKYLRSASLDESFSCSEVLRETLGHCVSLFLVSTAFALQANLPQQTPTLSIRGKVL